MTMTPAGNRKNYKKFTYKNVKLKQEKKEEVFIMKKRVTVITIGTVATIMVAGMALAGCNKNTVTNVAPTTTTVTVEPETTTVEPETTTTVAVEPETTTVVVEPETTTVTVEAETTTVAVEPETTTVAVEPETTTTVAVEPETTTTVAVEPETTTTVVVEPETTTVEPETTTVAVEPETTTVAEPVKDYVEFKVEGLRVPMRIYGDAPITPLEDWQTHAVCASNTLDVGYTTDSYFATYYAPRKNFEKCWKDGVLAYGDGAIAITLKEKYNLPNGVYERLSDLEDDLREYTRLTTGCGYCSWFDLDGKWVHELTRFEPLEFNEDGTKWLDSYTLEWFDTPSPSMGDEGLAAWNEYYGDRESNRRVILSMDEYGLEVGQYWYARVNLCNYGSVVYRISETEVVSYASDGGDASELLADYPDAVYWGEVR